MENLVEWFKDNKNCLSLFNEPKIKKAAIINNIFNLLLAETCHECQSENINNLFTNEEVVKLINFISENNKFLVTPAPLFDYKGHTYHSPAMIIVDLNKFLEQINSSENKFIVYMIYLN